MSDAFLQPLAPQSVSLTPEQRAAWARGDNAIAVVKIMGRLDTARLRRVMDEVLARHDILQARLGETLPAAAWTVCDLRGEPQAEAAAAADLRAQGEDSFAVERGELLRIVLYRLTEAEWRLAAIATPLVCDAGGLAILCRELRDVYLDQPLPTDNGRAGYGVYAAWRRELEHDADAAEGRAYWRDHLADQAAPLHLPYRFPDAAQAECPDVVRTAVDPEVARRLTDVAGRCGRPEAGLETVLQAAWWALLARICSREDLLVGWRHDCRRDYAPFARTLGVFEKVLPLRLRIEADTRFAELLARLAEQLENHLAWQEHCSVEAPREADSPAVGFALLPVQVGWADVVERDTAWRLVLPPELTGFELVLHVELDDTGNLVAVQIQFDPRRYDAIAARVLLEQFITLLAALPEATDLPVTALPVVGPAERARLLAVNAAALQPSDNLALPDAIARWAEKSPDAPALSGAGVMLSYAALEAQVRRLSAWLIAQGVGPEDIVALDMARSVPMVAALLAVWRAGGAYLPLDPQWPPARRRQLLMEAAPRLVLSDDPDALALVEMPVHDLTGVTASLERLPTPPAGAGGSESRLANAAYLLFTSGSTGKPKGVVVEHGQVQNYVAAVTAACGLQDHKRFALTSTVAADLGNTMLFGALYNGACLVVADAGDMADGVSFAAFLRREKIDCMKLTPSHLAALIDTQAPLLPDGVILGGEPAPRALVERLQQIAPGCRIFNHYGPTETTVGVMVHAHDAQARAQRAWNGGGLPLSQVLGGNAVYLLDNARQLVPGGALGELYIGGRQLCRGYHGAGDAVGASPFTDDPFHAGGRLFRTGDLGRWLPGGRLQLVGRVDRQLKLRGYRIEPGEVEAALAALDGVRQAAVSAWAPDGGERELVAYVSVSAEAPGDATERTGALRAALAAHLPEPMVPSRIVVLDHLPLLANGKIDRSRLPDPSSLVAETAEAAPGNPLEALLQAYVAEVLGRSPQSLGVTDNFFDMGGHSLQVIRLVARLRKTLKVEVPPGIVFDHPSIAELAAALRDHAEPGELNEAAAALLTAGAAPGEERGEGRGEGRASAPLAAAVRSAG